MTLSRRVLAPLTAIWLVCQVAAAGFVPFASLVGTADTDATECTCGHGAGAMCPMHHPSTGGPAPCAMQAANSPGTAVMLVGMTGLLTEPPDFSQPAISSTDVPAANDHLTRERPVPPDPPPPRC